jgi:outer membrane protein TolC
MLWLPFLVIFLISIGCRSGARTVDHRYRQLSHDYLAAQVQPAASVVAANPVLEQLDGPRPVQEFIQIGLLQNSEIQEMRLMVESVANRVPQAASLPDPMLGAMAFPSPVQTAAGEQEFALSMSQKIPWRGKLRTRAAIAEENVNVARAQLAAVELKVVEQIKNAYFQLYFIQQAITINEEEKKRLAVIESLVKEMYKVKREVTQQDWLQVQVELSRIDTDLLDFRAQKKSAQAQLARLLHISPETDLAALDSRPAEQTVQDIQQLYQIAIQARPELHAQLAKIQQDRRATGLAELQSYPDMTFGFNWIATSSGGVSPVANGDDAFMLTLGMNLPIYRKRNDAGVREAQTRSLSNARKYDRLKDETMAGVAGLFAKINSLRETLQLFRDDIIPKQKSTLSQSQSEYRVNKVDILQVITNWRQLLRFQIAEKRFETELQQSLASLARQIGDFELPNDAAPVQTPIEPAAENSEDEKSDQNNDVKADDEKQPIVTK